MKRIQTFLDRAKTIATAVALFVIVYVKSLQQLPPPGQPYTFKDFLLQAVLVGIAAGAIEVFGAALKSLVAKSRLLRRLISGNDDIEGYWIETCRDLTDGRVTAYSVASILYANGKYDIEGKDFDSSYNYTGEYVNVIHEYSDMQSKLVFNSKHIGDAGQEKSGYSLVRYKRPGTVITGYIGYYTDTAVQGRVDITGHRLIAPDEIALAQAILESDTLPETPEAIRRLVALQSQKLRYATQPYKVQSLGSKILSRLGIKPRTATHPIDAQSNPVVDTHDADSTTKVPPAESNPRVTHYSQPSSAPPLIAPVPAQGDGTMQAVINQQPHEAAHEQRLGS